MKKYINIETGKEIKHIEDLYYKVIRESEDAILIQIMPVRRLGGSLF